MLFLTSKSVFARKFNNNGTSLLKGNNGTSLLKGLNTLKSMNNRQVKRLPSL